MSAVENTYVFSSGLTIYHAPVFVKGNARPALGGANVTKNATLFWAIVLVLALALLAACGAYAPEETGLEEEIHEETVSPLEVDEGEPQIPAPFAPPKDIRPHHYGSFNEAPSNSNVATAYCVTRVVDATTLEALSAWAPNIVRGYLKDDARIVRSFHYTTPYTRIPTGGRNFVSLVILEVIQGDEISVGETITIMEPYYIVGGVFRTMENYMPSTPYKEYIFFLDPQSTSEFASGEAVGAFWVAHGHRSRFPVPAPGQSLDEIDLALGSRANVEIYMSLWQEVLDAFVH